MSDLALHMPGGATEHEASLVAGPLPGADPSDAFAHPRAVVDAAGLSTSDKRALLASWASDACAVEGLPAWRRLPGRSALVSVDDILDALQALDQGGLH